MYCHPYWMLYSYSHRRRRGCCGEPNRVFVVRSIRGWRATPHDFFTLSRPRRCTGWSKFLPGNTQRNAQDPILTHCLHFHAVVQAVRLHQWAVEQRLGEAEHQLAAAPVGHIEVSVEVPGQHLLGIMLEVAPAILDPCPVELTSMWLESWLTSARSLSLRARSMVCHS